MLFRTVISTLGFALLGASAMGCAARGAVVAGGSVDATYVAEPGYVSGAEVIIEEPAPQRVVFRAPPPLVVVEPDVYVVEDSSYAIYFVSGFYWHVGAGDRWYRSSRWDEPWVHVDLHIVPPRISHRDHHAYVGFHASASARVFRQPRERGGNDRALRIVEPRDVVRARAERDRKARVDPPRLDTHKPTPAAGPKPERRSAPKIERERVKPNPRPEVERDREKPRVDDARPRAEPDQARPDDKKKKKKKVKKKVDDKRKLKDPARDRPSR